MADDDVLQAKLFSFICGNGGFVDLADLLKSSSPLVSRKCEESAKKWLERRQGPWAGFACVKDKNGEIVGVRVDLGKKICHRYATQGVCRLRRCKQGNCKYWHICKTFVEGRCNEFCELSHDFYSDDNWEIAEALNLPDDKYSNESMKKIVSWNLPQVCELYQRNECTWSECPYIHVCTQFIKGSSHSNCFLSHDFEDSHNFTILEKYDFIQSSQEVNIDFVRSNVLIVEDQKRINTAFVSSDPASEQNQPSSLFTAGIREEIDQVNTAQVPQILVLEEQQVDELLNCKMPRAASINHLPTENALETTRLKSNMLTASAAVDSQTSLPSSQRINTAVVGSNPASEQNQPSSLFTAGVQEEIDQVNTAQVAQILVCEEQQVDESVNRKIRRAASTNDLPAESASEKTPLKSNMLTTSTAVDSQTSLPSSQTLEVSEFKSSVPSTHCLLTERRVFECLCKEYGSSASIQDIAGRKDLFPKGVESAEEWFREMTRGSLLITRGSQGTIAEVSAFSARARICESYNENGRCHRSDCSFLHICKGFVTGSCSNGVRCLRKHHLNDREKAFLGRIKLDQFNDQQLRQLVLSSTPRICVEYNNGICDRGDDCNRIHMCCGHIRKCCSAKSECGLDHEEAMDTKHTQAVLRRYLLHNVEKREAIAMILDDKLCLSGKEKAKGQYLFVLFLFTY